jgi:steroid 5-alpha reductase family enzyme
MVDEVKDTGLSGVKPAVDSGTIVSSVIALVAWFVSVWGHNLSQYDIVTLSDVAKNAVHAMTDVVGVAATIFAIYKRYTATEKIEGVLKVPQNPTKI